MCRRSYLLVQNYKETTQQEEGASFLRAGLVVMVRFCVLWCIVGAVGTLFGRINLLQLYSHTNNDLLGDVSELMETCTDRSLGSVTWSSRCSSDLARLVHRCVDGVCCYLWWHWRSGRGGSSGAKTLVWRWWICHSCTTSPIEGGGSWSKIA
jgi:hypothetical protein